MSELPNSVVRLAELQNRKRNPFKIEPDAAGRAALAEDLGALAVRKLRFEGALIPMGKRDWRLEATLGATVTQACVVTLDPVNTRIDEEITRSYVTNFEAPDETEVEMTEDDTTDPMPESLDLMEVVTEALALALPAYPRKDGVEIEVTAFTEPGKAAMTDEDARPFAGLASLRDSLENKDDD